MIANAKKNNFVDLVGTLYYAANDQECLKVQGVRNPNPGSKDRGSYYLFKLDYKVKVYGHSPHAGDPKPRWSWETNTIALDPFDKSLSGKRVRLIGKEIAKFPSDTSLPVGAPHIRTYHIIPLE